MCPQIVNLWDFRQDEKLTLDRHIAKCLNLHSPSMNNVER